jgi:hypothetical protein
MWNDGLLACLKFLWETEICHALPLRFLIVVFLMLYLGLMKTLGRWNWIIQETCLCGVVWVTTLTPYSSGKMVNIKKPH